MLIAGGVLSASNPEESVARYFVGNTFVLTTAENASVPGFSNSGPSAAGTNNLANNSQQKLRWRASKGSAPVNRFTRAIGNNQTETWHRTMPVAGADPVPAAPVSRGVVRAARTPREQRRAPRAQVVRRRSTTTGTQTVAVPATVVRSLAVAPTPTTGTATVATTPSTIKLVAVAPSVSLATQVAVPSSRITLNAVAPARTATVTRAVPAVAVRDIAVAPTVVPGTRTIATTPVVIRLLAVAPQVQNFILVPAASLRLGAIAPSVTGGGGGGGGTVTLRKSGD